MQRQVKLVNKHQAQLFEMDQKRKGRKSTTQLREELTLGGERSKEAQQLTNEAYMDAASDDIVEGGNETLKGCLRVRTFTW